jgi:hypothetical protein
LYLFTCEYCFSHYVTIFFLFITGDKLLFDDWRGYLIAGFSLVWLANVDMSLFGRLRLEIREDRMETAAAESRISLLATSLRSFLFSFRLGHRPENRTRIIQRINLTSASSCLTRYTAIFFFAGPALTRPVETSN